MKTAAFLTDSLCGEGLTIVLDAAGFLLYRVDNRIRT
jgi:hypothetical protein